MSDSVYASLVLWVIVLLAPYSSTRADDSHTSRLANFKSRHFHLKTDMPRDEARALLERLEATLDIVSKYWGRRVPSPIECYVVDDLSRWPRGAFPYEHARKLLAHVGGGVHVRPAGTGRRAACNAQVYAISERGVAEHEMVHAYCAQAFGAVGPDWYKEGMAEMVGQYRGRGRGVTCPREAIELLRADEPRTIDQIVGGVAFTAPIALLFSHDRDGSAGPGRRDSGASMLRWTATDDEKVRLAKESYYWSWSLCHFLCHNPNYSRRFRDFGRSILNRHDVSFEQAFGAASEQIEFEYGLFLRHLDVGYRVDLCRWEWTKKFSRIEPGDRTFVPVHAARGYQASGLLVSEGENYDFEATGEWSTKAGETGTTADGHRDSKGRLVGTVLHGLKLTEPFDLGARGSFAAPRSGRLYLRCQDAWHELGDNRGVIRVQLQCTADSPSDDT